MAGANAAPRIQIRHRSTVRVEAPDAVRNYDTRSSTPASPGVTETSLLACQRPGDLEPLVFQGSVAAGRGLAGPGIPVAGVSIVAFLAMEPRMDPCPGRIGEVLASVMSLVPAARP